MERALEIRDDLSARELRALAARDKKNRAAPARAAGIDRQALRDAVVRYNAEGPDGLHDRPTPSLPPALTEAALALVSARVFRGPDRETDGVSSWTPPDLSPLDRGPRRQATAAAEPVTHPEARGLLSAENAPNPPEN